MKCEAWEFDMTDSLGNTWSSQWNLVCDKKYLKIVAEMGFLFGVATGGIISGMLSDRFGRKKMLFISAAFQSFFGEMRIQFSIFNFDESFFLLFKFKFRNFILFYPFPLRSYHIRIYRSRSLFLWIFRALLSIKSDAGSRFRFGYLRRTHPCDRVCRWRLAYDCWNVQSLSTATLLHHDIRHRLLNTRLQIFTAMHWIAGSGFMSFVVSTESVLPPYYELKENMLSSFKVYRES